jgi:class 3 adenylate cyclase
VTIESGERFVLRVLGVEDGQYTVGEASLIIGRDPSCDVPLASRYVSRRHARIERVGDAVHVHELGSANPILVNGQEISGSRELAGGDTIRIADIVIEVLAGDPDATQVFMLESPEEQDTRSALTNTERNRISELVRMGGTVAILFTDLENSTRVTAQLGDARAQDYLRQHNELLREEFARHGGVEVKGFGDGFLVTFVSASAAARCAIASQRRLDEYNRANPEWPIRVRMGLNVGEVISEDEDIFGTAVITASRVMGRAQGGEILLSQPTEAIVSATGEFETTARGQVKLKGFDRMQRVYALAWREESGPSAD